MSTSLSPPNKLSTRRLVLEPLTQTHAHESFSLWQDEALYRYIPLNAPTEVGALASRYTMLAQGRSSSGKERWLNWFLRDRVSQALIGFVECTLFEDHSAQLAYFVFSPYQGRGFASEGCHAAMCELHARHDVHTVKAFIDTRNEPSLALARSLGFEVIERTTGADYFKGSPSDEFVLSRSMAA